MDTFIIVTVEKSRSAAWPVTSNVPLVCEPELKLELMIFRAAALL